MDEQCETWPAAVLAAEQVLSAAWGGPVCLAAPRALVPPGRKNLVLRCVVVVAPPGSPGTIVIKEAGRQGYDPADPDSPAALLFNDWAGAAFVAQLVGSPHGPAVYGGDHHAGIVVLEDIGDVSLAALLTEGDRRVVERALEALARRLGRLHGGLAGRRAEYEALRAGLGPVGHRTVGREAQTLRQAAADGPDALATVGIVVTDAAVRELMAVAAVLAEPGPWLAYTHGDPCPENALFDGATLRLIDFEFGGYRHALLDGVGWRMAFPTSPHPCRLPMLMADRLEAVYRRALGEGGPFPADDASFGSAVLDACAYWTFNWLRRPLGEAHSRLRRRIATRTRAFAALAARHASHLALRELAERVAAVIARRWPEDAAGVPLVRAFAAAPADRGAP